MEKILKLSFIFLAVVILLLTLFVGTASAKTWYVDDDDGVDFN